jgi:hypothetical protein
MYTIHTHRIYVHNSYTEYMYTIQTNRIYVHNSYTEYMYTNFTHHPPAASLVKFLFRCNCNSYAIVTMMNPITMLEKQTFVMPRPGHEPKTYPTLGKQAN